MKRILFFLSTILILSSCTTARKYTAENTYENKVEQSVTNPVNEARQRLVIYNAVVRLQSDKPDEINSQLNKIAAKHHGYVLSLSNKQSVIRVSSEQLNNTIEDISALAKVTGKTVSGNDVTDQYTDYTIRLDNANARKRYLELLSRAETVEAALKVEKELERITKTLIYSKVK